MNAPVEQGVAVRTWLESGQLLVVQVEASPELALRLDEPEVPGLEFFPMGEPTQEKVSGRTVVTRRYRYNGKPGYYEVAEVGVEWGPEEAPSSTEATPLFITVESADLLEQLGELGDISEPEPAQAFPWLLVGLAGGGLLLVGGGLGGAMLLGRSAPVVEERVESPDVRALREWREALDNPALDAYDRCVELSRIFRDYTEAVLDFPAASWTTTEILAHLGSMSSLEQGNVPRAKRLLRATDRVKYADAGMEGTFFEDLDADLRAFITSTRSRDWQDT